VRVADLLAVPELRLRLLAGRDNLHREISSVYTTDLPDPRQFLTGGELVLTSTLWHRSPADSARFVTALAEGAVAGLVAGSLMLGDVPIDLVDWCERAGLPLLAAANDVSYTIISTAVTDRLADERRLPESTPFSSARRLAATALGRDGPAALLAALRRETGVECFVLSPAARVAAATDAPAAGLLPRVWRVAVESIAEPGLAALPDGTVVSVYPTSTADRPGSGWLVCRADSRKWAVRTARAVEEVANLLGLASAQAIDRCRARSDVAARLLALVDGHPPVPAEVAAGMRAAGMLPDLPTAVLVARATGPLRASRLLSLMLAEVLGPDSVCTEPGPDGAVVALVPRPDRTDGPVATMLRDTLGWLAESTLPGRLAIGVGAAAGGADRFPEALEEARQLCRLAEVNTAGLAVVTRADIESHALLLAHVPADVRRLFRLRVLGPVLDYDDQHSTDLLGTLEAFLDTGGSWKASAARLHVHVNTLRYRVEQIARLTGRDLATSTDRVDFFIALRYC
jgi:Purine catabolism regulatory protein-like family/PucR C-terminal helix-turn-helix domain/GGDEF-like domain